MKSICRVAIIMLVFELVSFSNSYAQDSPTQCDQKIAETLREQLVVLPDTPDPKPFTECANQGSIYNTGISFYDLYDDVTRSLLSVPFETNDAGQVLVVAVEYIDGYCVLSGPNRPTVGECFRGWLNKQFVETGFPSTENKWIVIQNENVEQFKRELYGTFKEGMEKRMSQTR